MIVAGEVAAAARFDTQTRTAYISFVNDSLFPSGQWTGFYNYAPKDKHRMDMHLTFARGGIAGEGNDDIGAFFIRGKYDAATRECHWTKTYPGSHDVFYRGFREGKGIWGTWEIDLIRGGFHIWPRGEETGDIHAKAEEQPAPVEAVGVEEAAPALGIQVPKSL